MGLFLYSIFGFVTCLSFLVTIEKTDRFRNGFCQETSENAWIRGAGLIPRLKCHIIDVKDHYRMPL